MTDGLKSKHRDAIIKTLSANPKVARIVLFGSRAMGTFTPTSDIDIALFGDELTLSDQAALSEEMAELSIPQRVDILIYHRIENQALREHIRKHGVEWFARRQGASQTSTTGGGWRDTTLGDVLTLQRGFDLPESDREAGPYPVIASTGPVGTHNKAMVNGPGVVIGRSGRLGGGQFIEGDFWPLNTTLWVKDFKGNDRRFCYYLLKSLDLAHFNAGSGVPTLNRNHIHPLAVTVPSDPREQRAIAHILGTLDDKIELNRKQNATLEAMARALFKAWFVDFEPVRAKMEGRWQRGQSLPGLPAHLYDLFPDRLVESELGEIPEGWVVRTVGDCFSLTMGQSPPGDTYNEAGDGIPFFQGRTDFGFRYPANRKYCSAPTRIANAEDTLVSVRAPVGDINLAWEKCCIGRGVAALRHSSGGRSFTYYAIWSLQEQLRQYEHTGTVFGAINKKQFECINFVEPSSDLISIFEVKIGPLDDEIRNNLEESRTLAQLRDTLLPKLISGEIRVKDAERFLKERGL